MEKRQLTDLYNRREAQFVALYGRRRIGKTSLLLHWSQQVAKENCIYWMARKSSSHILLKELSELVGSFMGLPASGFAFSDWQGLLSQLGKMSKEKRIVMIIDEFPYLVESVPEFPGILQRTWDLELKETRIFLAISGSHYHKMLEEFASEKRPLFGRTTGQIVLDEIAPDQLHEFLPHYGAEQIVETYSVIGGVPKYLELWDDERPVMKNIEEAILSPVTIFRQEPLFLIQDEISEPRTYLAVLEALGQGALTPKAISEATGIALSHTGKYLQTLVLLRFVRKIISLTAPDVHATRTTRYEIRDPFLRFYFAFILPNVPLLEQNRDKKVIELIRNGFDSYVSKNGFEEICRRHVVQIGDGGNLPFSPGEVGRMWNKHAEIDVVAIDKNDSTALLGECKWTMRKTGEEVLDALIDKGHQFPLLKSFKIHYALFSKSGFTENCIKKAKSEDVFLFAKTQHGLLADVGK